MARFLAALLAAFILTATAAVATAAPPSAALDLGAGLGCSVQCIKQATLKTTKTGATITVRTDTPAIVSVQAGTSAPLPTSAGPMFSKPAASAKSAGRTTTFVAKLTGLEPGTTYHVVARAIDADGRIATRQGTFSTKALVRSAVVTFYSIDVIDDDDSGLAGKGELQFWLHAASGWIGPKTWDDYYVVKSGSTIQLKTGSHNGALVGVPNAPAVLPLHALGVECDSATWSGCVYESGTFPTSGGGSIGKFEYANASTAIDLDACAETEALPPNYGTDLPAGGDCYFSFETTAHHVKYRVNGWVNVSYS